MTNQPNDRRDKFDEKAAIKASCEPDHDDSFVTGARWQFERDQREIERLREALEKCRIIKVDGITFESQVAREALAGKPEEE